MKQLLKELGMTKASKKLNNMIKVRNGEKEFLKKTIYAYTQYKFIEISDINRFRKKLKENIIETRTHTIEKKLRLVKLENYDGVPPEEVLVKTKEAKDTGLFDDFSVAYMETVRNEKPQREVDPIIFGIINGCKDLFFIAEWDDDISFEELKNV